MAEKKCKNNPTFVVPSPFSEELLFPKTEDDYQKLGWTYDVVNDQFYCSEALNDALKRLETTPLSLMSFMSYVHPNDQERMTLQWHVATDHQVPLMTVCRLIVDHNVLWVEVIARLEKGQRGLFFVGTLSDITRSMNLEENEPNKPEEPKRNLLSTISHELRTPMNAIIGFADILDKEIHDPDQKIYVERIQEASSHMLSMINDVLDLSKIDAGKLMIENMPFSLEKLLDSTLKMVEPLAKRKHLFLEQEIYHCPDFVLGDMHRIRQILLNLLSNAIKFTETGGISFVVQGEKIAHSDTVWLHFMVKDTGIGLTDQQKSRLFHDFEQADSTTSRLYGGTGLGLSISSKLAHLMQGKITVESKLNEGSTFTLSLPLKIALKEEEHDKAPIIDEKRFKDTYVLIAEDHQLSQMLIQHILTKLDVHITLVDNGKKAVDLAKSTTYDWIILDMEMPILGGLEAAQMIRRFNEKTPILAMTANHLDEDRARCFLAGMNDVILKPIDRNHLLSTLLKWLPELNAF